MCRGQLKQRTEQALMPTGKAPGARTEETKIWGPEGVKQCWEFAHRCLAQWPFLEQPVVPDVPVQETLWRRIAVVGKSALVLG